MRDGNFNKLIRSYVALRSQLWVIPLVVGFVVFFVITAGVLAYSFFGLFEKGDLATFLKSFAPSLAASFLEDLVFFILIGIIPIIYAFKDPSRYGIDKRARWLFNASNFDPKAIDYLVKNIKRIAVYSPKCTMEIFFLQPSEDGSAVMANIRSTRKFSNLFREISLEEFPLTISASADDVFVNGRNGELTAIYLLKKSSSPTAYHDGPVSLEKPYKKEFFVKVEGDGEFEVVHEFWVWYKVGEPFWFKTVHWTGEMNVVVMNKSEFTSIKLRNERTGFQKELKLGDMENYSYPELPGSNNQPFVLEELVVMKDCPGTTG